jgi:hypothetical protein
MLAMFGSLKWIALSSAITFAVGSLAGWKTRDAFCDAAEAKAQVEHLQRQVNAQVAADKVNSELSKQQMSEISKLEQQADELRDKISAGVCFTAHDVDRLRNLWPRAE